jgi:hypothetical protein
MRKKIVPALALSFISLGTVSTVAMPVAHAATHHAMVHAGEDGDDDNSDSTPATVADSGGSGSSSTPSGGVSTGAGGMAEAGSTDVAPWLAEGGAGAVLLGMSAGATAIARRRRTVRA